MPTAPETTARKLIDSSLDKPLNNPKQAKKPIKAKKDTIAETASQNEPAAAEFVIPTNALTPEAISSAETSKQALLVIKGTHTARGRLIDGTGTHSRSQIQQTYASRRKHIKDGKSLTRSTTIAPRDRADMLQAWFYTREAGRPELVLNQFLTLRPDLDRMDPWEREAFWSKTLNRLRVACRDLGFKFVAIMSRESDPHPDRIGMGEHLHILLHVPDAKVQRLQSIIANMPGSNWLTPASYDMRWEGRKRKYAAGYLLKAAHPQDRFKDGSILFRPSGPIIGWRVRTTKDLAARQRDHAAPGIAARKRIETERILIGRRQEVQEHQRATMERQAQQNTVTEPRKAVASRTLGPDGWRMPSYSMSPHDGGPDLPRSAAGTSRLRENSVHGRFCYG